MLGISYIGCLGRSQVIGDYLGGITRGYFSFSVTSIYSFTFLLSFVLSFSFRRSSACLLTVFAFTFILPRLSWKIRCVAYETLERIKVWSGNVAANAVITPVSTRLPRLRRCSPLLATCFQVSGLVAVAATPTPDRWVSNQLLATAAPVASAYALTFPGIRVPLLSQAHVCSLPIGLVYLCGLPSPRPRCGVPMRSTAPVPGAVYLCCLPLPLTIVGSSYPFSLLLLVR